MVHRLGSWAGLCCQLSLAHAQQVFSQLTLQAVLVRAALQAVTMRGAVHRLSSSRMKQHSVVSICAPARLGTLDSAPVQQCVAQTPTVQGWEGSP